MNETNPQPVRQSRGDRWSVAGYCYSDNSGTFNQTDARILTDVQTTEEIKRNHHVKQSRKMPRWIWFMLAKSLGLKLHPGDMSNPWVGTLLHAVTLFLAFLYAISNTWYTGYDIVSEYTKQTLLKGSVQILVGLIWCSLGVYANKLAGNLFRMPKFVDSVRMHSKTILKVNSAMIMIVASIGLIVLHSYDSLVIYRDSYCQTVGLPALLCKVMYISNVSYSILAVFWNLLVGIVLLSVCRTHTIGIRRFIREMEEDGKIVIAAKQSNQFLGPSRRRSAMIVQRKTSDDDDVIWDDEFNPFIENTHHPSLDDTDPSLAQPSDTSFVPGDIDHTGLWDTQQTTHHSRSDTSSGSIEEEPTTVDEQVNGFQQQTQYGDSASQVLEPKMLTNNEILVGYYKVSCRLRATSLCLQRWMASWIFFITIWSITYIIYWLTHTATVIEVLQFVFSLLLLPLVSSAFAEVNTEGHRLVKVFGFPLNYSVILTVMGALALAFSSRIILDEIFPPSISRSATTPVPIHNSTG